MEIIDIFSGLLWTPILSMKSLFGENILGDIIFGENILGVTTPRPDLRLMNIHRAQIIRQPASTMNEK